MLLGAGDPETAFRELPSRGPGWGVLQGGRKGEAESCVVPPRRQMGAILII